MAEAKEVIQPWMYTHVNGGEHPDNNPPLTVVAVASDEAVEAEEAHMNMLYAQGKAVAPAPPSVVPRSDEPKPETQSVNLEDHTVAELKDIAAQKGVELNWDDNKTDIIKKIKKAK